MLICTANIINKSFLNYQFVFFYSYFNLIYMKSFLLQIVNKKLDFLTSTLFMHGRLGLGVFNVHICFNRLFLVLEQGSLAIDPSFLVLEQGSSARSFVPRSRTRVFS